MGTPTIPLAPVLQPIFQRRLEANEGFDNWAFSMLVMVARVQYKSARNYYDSRPESSLRAAHDDAAAHFDEMQWDYTGEDRSPTAEDRADQHIKQILESGARFLRART